MLQLLQRILLAGATVAVLGLALVGLDAATGPRQSDAQSSDIAEAAEALLAADATAVAGAAAGATERLRAPELRRLAAWRRLVHATAMLDLPALGGITTIQLDHGTVSAVDASSLTIAEAGGASVTVALGAETRVRRNGARAAIGDLAVGDEAFVMSRVETDGTEAYLVVVPRD